MAITGSGEIKLRADVNNEIEGNNTDTDVSLRTLSASAGESVPDALSEFYGYSSAETYSAVDIVVYVSDNCSDSGTYSVGTVSDDLGSAVYIKGGYIYSSYGGSVRAANITIEYSDDNSNWTTAYTTSISNNTACAIQNSANYASETDANVTSKGAHRYWRWVEGSAISGHHPRVSRIGLYQRD